MNEKIAEGLHYKIGDVVPYKNTRGNIMLAKITGFRIIARNKKIWFEGFDIKTQADVFYPEHKSILYEK